MANISVTFRNNTSDRKLWVIQDQGVQPPAQLFSDYLDPSATTTLSVYQIDGGLSGLVAYQGYGGPLNTGNTVYDGDNVDMS